MVDAGPEPTYEEKMGYPSRGKGQETHNLPQYVTKTHDISKSLQLLSSLCSFHLIDE